MKQFRISEFAEYMGFSYNGANKKIDSLIKKVKEGKLTGEINRSEELIDGRMIRVVNISEDLLELLVNEPKTTGEIHTNEPVHSPNVTNSQYIAPDETLSEKIRTQDLLALANRLADYAEKAGQVKLLESNLNSAKDDYKAFQESYFETKYKNETLTGEIEKLKKVKFNLLVVISLMLIVLIVVSSLFVTSSINNMIREAENARSPYSLEIEPVNEPASQQQTVQPAKSGARMPQKQNKKVQSKK